MPPLHPLLTSAPGGGGDRRRGTKRLTTAEFIIRSNIVHGVGTYDYSEVFYINKRTDVRIICPVHGPFEQGPPVHWAGGGCLICGNEKASQTRTLTTAEFIAAAQALHGVGTYDYSEVAYTHSNDDVTIICPTHGRFEQRAGQHLFNTTHHPAGCPLCAHKRATIKRARIEHNPGRVATLYLVRFYDENESFYKVGITSRNVKVRLYRLSRESGYAYELVKAYKAPDFAAAYDWEQQILKKFSYLSYKPLRHFGGETECFNSASEIVDIFPR